MSNKPTIPNKLKSSELMLFSANLTDKMSEFAKATGLELTPAVKERLSSGAREAYMVLADKNLTPADLDINNIVSVFQSVGFLPINPNAYPRQSYFSTRKMGKETVLEYNVQGSGWETLLRTYGVDILDFKSVVIREGDYVSGIEYVGFEQKPPHIKLLTNDEIIAKGLHKGIRKVKQVIYMLKTISGYEYHAINREDVKANILAQAKNNGAKPELILEMSQLSVDEILDPNGKYLNMQIKNNWGNNVHVLSPTYRDESSREGMIITKMKKYFCNKYEKDYNKDPENKDRGEMLQRFYDNVLAEDRYVHESETVEEIIEESQNDFTDNANKEQLQDENETLGNDIEVDDDFFVDENEFEEELEDLELEEELEEPQVEQGTPQEQEKTSEIVVDENGVVKEEAEKEKDIPDWF